MHLDELKRKLRELKKLEITIRFSNRKPTPREKLVFDSFFNTKDSDIKKSKYSILQLSKMSHGELKEVIDEYFYNVYFEYYRENGITLNDQYDPTLLSLLELPMGATLEDIKGQFRKLALKYHPDKGGDSERFIELVDIYKKLTENE